MRHVPFVSLVLLSLLLGGADAHAQANPHPWRIADEYPPVVMRLRYSPPKGCPDEDTLRGAVVVAVPEWYPFGDDAPWVLAVAATRSPRGWVGTAELRDAATDRLEWTESMPARRSCKELLLDLAEALAIYIDSGPKGEKAAAPVAAPVPAPAPELPPAPASPIVKAAQPPPLPKRNVGLVFGVDADFNALLAPTGLAGGSVWVAAALRDPALSFELDLRVLDSITAAQEQVPRIGFVPYRWTYVSGVLAAALHRGPLFAGPVLEAGSFPARTQAPKGPTYPTAPLVVGAGFRIGTERVSDGFVVRGTIDVEYLLKGPPLAAPLHDVESSAAGTHGLTATVALGIGLR